jgi:hypothetical protein
VAVVSLDIVDDELFMLDEPVAPVVPLVVPVAVEPVAPVLPLIDPLEVEPVPAAVPLPVVDDDGVLPVFELMLPVGPERTWPPGVVDLSAVPDVAFGDVLPLLAAPTPGEPEVLPWPLVAPVPEPLPPPD